jgi:hypothetical protein
MLPSSFPLDEALASAQQVEDEQAHGLELLGAGDVAGGLSVLESSKKLDSYLGQLQSYLEVSDGGW